MLTCPPVHQCPYTPSILPPSPKPLPSCRHIGNPLPLPVAHIAIQQPYMLGSGMPKGMASRVHLTLYNVADRGRSMPTPVHSLRVRPSLPTPVRSLRVSHVCLHQCTLCVFPRMPTPVPSLRVPKSVYTSALSTCSQVCLHECSLCMSPRMPTRIQPLRVYIYLHQYTPYVFLSILIPVHSLRVLTYTYMNAAFANYLVHLY